MPMNNNQRVQSAAARLAKLPVVHSACSKLSLLYTDAKCSNPSLRSVCEGLESSVTAIVSPVLVQLEPHISTANNVACRSLDWLETTFPVLHTPTEQIVATAKIKMHEIQDVVGIVASGTVDCVQHSVTWLVGRMQQVDQPDQSIVGRAISVASVGLDSALIVSEALMDRVLPPTEEDKEKEAHLLEGFDVATTARNYPVRLVSLAARLYRRTYNMVESKMHSVQIMESLSRSSVLVQDLQTSWQTLAWHIQGLPQYVQHQLVSALFFISQMYKLSCPSPQHPQSNHDRRSLNAAETSPPKATTPTSRMRWPPRTPALDNGCNVNGCVQR